MTDLKEKPVPINDNGIEELDTRGINDDKDPPNNGNTDNISNVPIQDNAECGKDTSNANRIIGKYKSN